MQELEVFLKALPSAASSPYALFAYVCTLVAWVVISYRVTRNKNLLDRIQDYSEADRVKVVSAEMDRPIPPGLTAEEWLRYRRNQLIAIAITVLIVCISVVACAAIFIEQPNENYPQKLSKIKTAELQVSSIDDFMQVYVNDHLIEDAKFGQTPPWRPFQNFLKKGVNAVKVIINNGEFGGCGGTLDFRINGKIYEKLQHSWIIPMRDATKFGNCTISVFSLNFE